MKSQTPKKELDSIWKARLRLCAEGDKLLDEGLKLCAEGDKLCAEGYKLWADGILVVHGKIKVKWEYIPEKKDFECHLETGEVFRP